MARLTPISFFEIDVRWLARCGGLLPSASMSVVERINGRPRGTVSVKALDPEAVLVGHQVIEIVHTPVHLGGRRPWFSCPQCRARVAILYGSPFACRRCHDVAYASQKQPPQERRLIQAQRIREKLGGTGSMVEPFPARPRGMHRATHDRLWARYLVKERSSLAMLAGRWRTSA